MVGLDDTSKLIARNNRHKKMDKSLAAEVRLNAKFCHAIKKKNKMEMKKKGNIKYAERREETKNLM